MTIDVVTFNGEYDVLEIRMNVLKDVVDQFIVVEADTTFSGLKKELFFPKQADRYSAFNVKYCVINQETLDQDEELNKLADGSPSVPKGMHWWHREFRQKETIKKFLTHLDDEDVVYLGDCDEIWKPKEIGEKIYKLRQLMYCYYLNNRSNELWAGTVAAKYKNLKKRVLNYMRQVPPSDEYHPSEAYKAFLNSLINEREYLDDGGWHFSSLGGEDELKRKLESYGHQELNIPLIKDNLTRAIAENKDFIGRNFTFWVDESDLPEYIITNRQKYAHLLK